MILAIDFGSTTIKAGMFDRKLRQLTEGNAPGECIILARADKVEMPGSAAIEEAVRLKRFGSAKPKGVARDRRRRARRKLIRCSMRKGRAIRSLHFLAGRRWRKRAL